MQRLIVTVEWHAKEAAEAREQYATAALAQYQEFFLGMIRDGPDLRAWLELQLAETPETPSNMLLLEAQAYMLEHLQKDILRDYLEEYLEEHERLGQEVVTEEDYLLIPRRLASRA